MIDVYLFLASFFFVFVAQGDKMFLEGIRKYSLGIGFILFIASIIASLFR